MGAAAWSNLWNERTRGASTVSMQLAGLIRSPTACPAAPQHRAESRPGRPRNGWIGSWRKDEILEAYLNRVPFRGELVGIDALSRTLFGKAAHGLDEREAAITAALVRAPNAGRPESQRACGILLSCVAPAPGDAVDSLGLTLPACCCAAGAPSDGAAPHLASGC